MSTGDGVSAGSPAAGKGGNVNIKRMGQTADDYGNDPYIMATPQQKEQARDLDP